MRVSQMPGALRTLGKSRRLESSSRPTLSEMRANVYLQAKEIKLENVNLTASPQAAAVGSQAAVSV